MSQVAEILTELRGRGVSIAVEGGDTLCLKPKRALERGEAVMAGALAEPHRGAVLVFRGDSPAAAESFAKNDPYVKSGLVTKWEVKQWATVLGDGAEMPQL